MKPGRPETNPLLVGPILPTLLKLSLPNVVAMLMSVLVGVAETYYVGILGTAHLAAMALVFPFAMLTGMMSAGAMGGGVSSSVSRALGAGDPVRAQAAALHAVVIGAAAGAVYSIVFLVFGPALYRVLGGEGRVLALAVEYSAVLFCGAAFVWLINTLASVLRGTGNMRVPSTVILSAAALQIVIGGVLGLGLGPAPRLGLPGVALGQIIANAIGVGYLLWYLRSGRGRLTLAFKGIALRGALFADILKVGAVACLSPVQSVLAVLVFTGLIARIGVVELAGYGIGQRLEFLLIPIAFGIGVASVPMVGMAIGAGQVARARRVAWTAGAVSAVNLGVVGLVVSLAPDLWAGLFTQDPQVLAHARAYLRWAGPAFAFFGLGLTLYFASQGSGRVLGPVLASTLRLVLVAAAGSWLAARDAPTWAYFALVGVAMVAYGLSTALAVRITPWSAPAPKPAPPAPARA
ncbi:MAG TPA: MATE family efflux transporter [Quisquiliibacterium sp.]|nr:MATE family efflux transporter [Quisquiliibacterium sp.]